MRATSFSQRSTAQPWITSWKGDLIWFLSGFWLPLVLVLTLFLPELWQEPLLWGVTLCFWIAHRLSSMYLAWCVNEYRDVVRQRPGYFVGLPLVLLLGLACWLLPPESVLPLPRGWRFATVAVIDYFWALYHFSRQHYGVLSIYRHRQRQSKSVQASSHCQSSHRRPSHRRQDWMICLWVSGGVGLLMDLHYGAFDPVSVWSGWFSGGLWTGQMGWFKGMLSACLMGFGWVSWRRYQRTAQSLPRQLYLLSLFWLALTALYIPPVLYFMVLQVQHWLVSLGLTQFMASRSQRVYPDLWARTWFRVNQRPWGALMVLMILSLGLTRFLEADAQVLEQLPGRTVQGSWGLYVLATLAFWSAAVHYLYDRGVFHFSDAQVRQAAGPLLLSNGLPIREARSSTTSL